MGVKSLLLGTGVKQAHTVNETVTLSDLVHLVHILLRFIVPSR